MTTSTSPKKCAANPTGAAVRFPSSQLYVWLKHDIRASLALAAEYRRAGEREVSFQFLNDANLVRAELNQRMGWA
ncbi:hypothetical protein [Photobacterium halotolerans]|uniref:Uncharacterized protein n=1 Tax=Photobacterium halotolerans TaxID=265726 RepID=A0A7X5AS81_9GAMM|nr:hypothetical protein [Photobacterium halotolerans]NAW64532.1 hypothetical protein [Photobacterium halotolerans]